MIRPSIVETVARCTNISLGEVSRWLALGPDDIIRDSTYLEQFRSLNAQVLEETLPEARRVMSIGLKPIADSIRHDHGIPHEAMSHYTIGNWLVGFVEAPAQLSMFQGLHGTLSRSMMANYLDDMIAVIDQMEQGREDWKRAVALLTVALISGVD